MMIMKEWTKEWYQVLSPEQLSDILMKAKEAFQNSRRWEQETARLMWSFRVQKSRGTKVPSGKAENRT